MKKIALLLTAIALTCTSANAQSLLKQLGNRAKNAVERNVENKVEKAINDALDGNKGSKKDNMGETSVQETIPQEYELVDPYTVTGRPSHSIPLGLPQNDDAPAPTNLPADCVSYVNGNFVSAEIGKISFSSFRKS